MNSFRLHPSVTNQALWPRRRFLQTLGLAACAPVLIRAAEAGAKMTPAEAFAPVVESFMRERGIPGGALAVLKNGRLVYAQGYGWADREEQIPARPTSLFRIASVSKPITAVAVLKLVEQGRLDMDARPFELLQLRAQIPEGKTLDERWTRVTIRQLLQHTGGWDRDQSLDPMFRAVEIAKELGGERPAGAQEVIRWMLGRKFDFDPGTRYAYSNFGYCVLGRVIEKVSGQSYENFVREKILAPLGIQTMRIGASLEGGQVKDEVHYYTKGDGKGRNVFSDTPKQVPWPYGGFYLEAMDAHGGWIASAEDLARFTGALDVAAPSPLLRPETLRTMYAAPPPPVAREKDGKLQDSWYGCGWMVRPVGEKANYWHSGSLPGTSSLLVRRWDGLSWAVVFNQRSEDKKLPDGAIDGALHRAAEQVTEWSVAKGR